MSTVHACPDHTLRNRWRTPIVVALLVIGFFCVDLIVPFFMGVEPTVAAMVLIGTCIGQINLLATWISLAPGNVIQRLSWSALLAVWSWYCIVVGFRIFEWSELFVDVMTKDDVVLLGCMMFAAFIAAQIPLWIAARIFRWRLVSSIGVPDQAAATRPQFQLKNLLWLMFVLAITMAPARLILPKGNIHLSSFADARLWLVIGVAIVTNMLITVPCIWTAFIRTWPVIIITVPLFVAYCAFVGFAEILALVLLTGDDAPAEVYGHIFFLNTAQYLAVFLPLVIFRLIGFRFVRLPKKGKRKLDAEATGQSNGRNQHAF